MLKEFKDNKTLDLFLGGWQFAGVATYVSAPPLQASANNNFDIQGTNAEGVEINNRNINGTTSIDPFPVLTCDPSKDVPSGYMFNTACFAAPNVGQLGNTVMPYIKGNAYKNLDLSLFKNFSIGSKGQKTPAPHLGVQRAQPRDLVPGRRAEPDPPLHERRAEQPELRQDQRGQQVRPAHRAARAALHLLGLTTGRSDRAGVATGGARLFRWGGRILAAGSGPYNREVLRVNLPRLAHWTAVACLAGLAAPGLAQAPAGNFAEAVAKAAAAREGRPEEALRWYREAVRLRPSWDEGWWWIGALSYERGDHEESARAFSRFVELKPDAGPGWALLGLSEFERGRYDAALAHLTRGLSLGTVGNAEVRDAVYYHVALLRIRAAQFELAVEPLSVLARAKPDSPRLVTACGLVLLRRPYLPADVPAEKHDLVREAGAASCAALALQDAAGPRFEELLRRYPKTPNLHYGYGAYLLRRDEANAAAALAAVREGDRGRPGVRLRAPRDRLRAPPGRPARPRPPLRRAGREARARALRGPQRPRPGPLRDRPGREGDRRAGDGRAPRPREPAGAGDPGRGLRAGRPRRGRGARAGGVAEAWRRRRGRPRGPRWPGSRACRARRGSHEIPHGAAGTGLAGRGRSSPSPARPPRARRRSRSRRKSCGASVFRVDAEVVLLDVVARDKKGRTVRDLRPDEVEVYEDGVRQETGNFRFLDSRAIGEALEDAAAAPAAPTAPRRPPSLRSPGRAATSTS